MTDVNHCDTEYLVRIISRKSDAGNYRSMATMEQLLLLARVGDLKPMILSLHVASVCISFRSRTSLQKRQSASVTDGL